MERRSTTLNEINKVFKEVLDNNNIVLSDLTTADDIEEWDSLTHMQLVVAIEAHFNLRFTSREIQSWANVGEMVNCIETRKN